MQQAAPNNILFIPNLAFDPQLILYQVCSYLAENVSIAMKTGPYIINEHDYLPIPKVCWLEPLKILTKGHETILGK
jgi:hypothetical protein